MLDPSVKITKDIMEKSYIDFLVTKVTELEFPWYYVKLTGHYEFPDNLDENLRMFSFAHTLYVNDKPNSNFYNMFDPLITTILKVNDIPPEKVFRIRLGMINNVGEQLEHLIHTDMSIDHKTILFYLNDSDGPTRFYTRDPKNLQLTYEQQPEANTCVMFDGSILHSSMTPVKHNCRLVLNINVLEN
jgi:hypothetical protein